MIESSLVSLRPFHACGVHHHKSHNRAFVKCFLMTPGQKIVPVSLFLYKTCIGVMLLMGLMLNSHQMCCVFTNALYHYGYLNAHSVHGAQNQASTGQAWRGREGALLFLSFYCLGTHVQRLQLEEAWYEISKWCKSLE